MSHIVNPSSPGGLNGGLQYNDNGVLAGIPTITYNKITGQFLIDQEVDVQGLTGYPKPSGFFVETSSTGVTTYTDGYKVVYRLYAHFDTGGTGTWSPYAEASIVIDSGEGPVPHLVWDGYVTADSYMLIRNYYDTVAFGGGYFGPGFTTYVTTSDTSFYDNDEVEWLTPVPDMEFKTQQGSNTHYIDYVNEGLTWGFWTENNIRSTYNYFGHTGGSGLTGKTFKVVQDVPVHVVSTETDESDFDFINTAMWIESESSGNGAGVFIDGSNSNSGLAWIVFSGFETENRGGYFFGLNNSGNLKISKLNVPYDVGSYVAAKDNQEGLNFDKFNCLGVNTLPFNSITEEESFMAQFTIRSCSSEDYSSPLRFISSEGLLPTNPVDGCFEYDGIDLYFTVGSTRDVLTRAPSVLTNNQIVIADSLGQLVSSGLTIPSALNNLTSGTYTPTLTNVANVAASTAYQCQYLRVGSTVTVSGKLDVDPTLAATSTQVGISLPVASNFGAAQDCGGVAFASGIAAQGAAILADSTNDRAQLQYVSSDITNQPMYFTFTYEVI